MKVLYLIDTLAVGGAETSILEIASRLEQWTPILVHLYPGADLKNRFEEGGIKVYSLNIQSKFGILEAHKKLSGIIKIEKPTLIHATLFKAELVSRLIGPKFNLPIINSFVNDSYSPERYKLLKFTQRATLDFYKLVDRLTAYRVTKFMSITQAIILNNTDALNLKGHHVTVIYRGRDIKAFREKINKDKIEKMKVEFGAGPNILTVSRLLIRKGYMDSIRAMKRVIEIHPSTKYLIAGEGHDRNRLESLIRELKLEKSIILLGNRNDVPTLLAFSDIFLFPSHYEGQGGALVEAMILGKPIISSRIPVIEESVIDNFSAILFEPQIVEDISNKLIWAIENFDQMKIFGFNAQMEAEQRFDINTVASKHEEMYNDVVKNFN